METTNTGPACLALALCLCAGPLLAAGATVPLYLMTVPPHVVEQAGRRGIIGDIVLEAMRRAGLQAQIRVEPNPRAMQMVKQNDDMFIAPMSRTRIPEREQAYTWVAPILPIHRAFFSLRRKADSYADAKAAFKRIAVSRNTANYDILLAQGFARHQLVQLNAGESAPRMLLAGRVDAWFNLIPESEALLRQIGASPLAVGKPLGTTDLYLACSKKCDRVKVRKLVAALAAMKADGTTRRLIAHYAREPGFAPR